MADTPLSLAVLLEHATRVHGDARVSTWTGTGLRTASFQELGRRAAQLARALGGLGVEPGDRIGTLMCNNAEHMTAYMAVPAMGAVLHTLNLRLTPRELAYIANDGGDRVLLVDASLLPLLEAMFPDLETVEQVVVANGDPRPLGALPVHGYDALLQPEAETYDWPLLDEHTAAAMCYTSGTTGPPKGVVYSHRSMWLHSMASCMPTAFGLTAGDSILAIVPMFHALCWGAPHAAMMVGASLVLPDSHLHADQLAALMAVSRPTLSIGVPTIWQGLDAHLREHPQDVSHLRAVVVGGAAVPPALIEAFEREHDAEQTAEH
ncbi:MAG: AMP-binding protein, partial [Solirubrobacteraceae bacterium]